jgi:hypothetical protein
MGMVTMLMLGTDSKSNIHHHAAMQRGNEAKNETTWKMNERMINAHTYFQALHNNLLGAEISDTSCI